MPDGGVIEPVIIQVHVDNVGGRSRWRLDQSLHGALHHHPQAVVAQDILDDFCVKHGMALVQAKRSLRVWRVDTALRQKNPIRPIHIANILCWRGCGMCLDVTRRSLRSPPLCRHAYPRTSREANLL